MAMYCVKMRPRTSKKEVLRPTFENQIPIWKKVWYGSPGAEVHFRYVATRYVINKGSTSKPVVKSTKAKATMKYVAGVRKHLRGSLNRVNSSNTLLVIVIGDIIARQIPVASSV